MRKFIQLIIVILSFTSVSASAQYTFVYGDHTLEFGGLVGVFYNQRFMKPGINQYKKDRFSLRDMQLDVEGRSGNNWEYRVRVDFADFSSVTSGAALDPENPGLMNAYIEYKQLPVHIKFGYDKLPYSQGSLNDVYHTPFWSRGVLTDGSMFSRRDIGLTLSSSFWKQRINMYGGVYTGLGENIIANGDNDDSGHPEFIGRIDAAFPSRYRYNEIDEVGVPIPICRIGINARYADKTQPGSSTLPEATNSDYGLRVLNGKKLAYGMDASFAYRNFTAQLESQNIIARPASQSDALYANTPESINDNKIKAGGYLAQLNYCWQAVNSVVAVRYEHVNLNDLLYGHSEWLYIGYAYQINGFNNVIKVQYYKPLKEDVKSDPLKWEHQIRIGWQYIF